MGKNIARTFALSIVSAGLIGGAALAMASMANATPYEPNGPGYSYATPVQAPPAPESVPGWHGHHGVWHVENVQPGYHR
jgi:hypothetical protein